MMISLINYFKKSILLLDLVGAFLVNFLYLFFNREKNNESKNILAYAPFKNKPWILNKIFNDLKASSTKKENYHSFKYLLSLAIFRFKKGGSILSMHQSNLNKLFFAGFKLSDISTVYTHTRIKQRGIKQIGKVKKIFCQNNYEYALLKSSNIKEEKIVNFPIGLHPNFLIEINNLKRLNDREFDVMFSLRYQNDNYHYSLRKRYDFIIKLSNLLSESKLRVLILGEGWNQIKSSLSNNVFILNPSFKDFPNIYQNCKIYCNPSLVEGGPISLPEAFSSGCIICTTPVGLSFNLCLNDDLSFLIPFNVNEEVWHQKILELIKNKNINENYKCFLDSRLANIGKVSFKNLSNNLEKNILDFN